LNERWKEIEAKTIEFRISGVSIKDLRDRVDKRKKMEVKPEKKLMSGEA